MFQINLSYFNGINGIFALRYFNRKISLMNVYTKFILISMLCCRCNYHNKIKLQPKIDPYYLSKYEAMKNVNTKNNLINFVVKDSANREYKIIGLSKGYTSVIKLWATWCTPCIKSMPEFVSLQHKYKENKNLQFYTVSIDYEYEDWKNHIKK
jgi:thiol-disulfide isomerase/thioredoxin